jgi:hypothetical protein
MIVHVSKQTIVTETYDDVADREEAVRRFILERGFASLEEAAEHEGLTAEEFRQSLVIHEHRAE